MNHEEIDQGKKRRATFNTFTLGQTLIQICAAAPDRVALKIFLPGIATTTSTVLSQDAVGATTIGIKTVGVIPILLTRDVDGDNVTKAYWAALSTGSNGAWVFETFEEPCPCVD